MTILFLSFWSFAIIFKVSFAWTLDTLLSFYSISNSIVLSMMKFMLTDIGQHRLTMSIRGVFWWQNIRKLSIILLLLLLTIEQWRPHFYWKPANLSYVGALKHQRRWIPPTITAQTHTHAQSESAEYPIFLIRKELCSDLMDASQFILLTNLMYLNQINTVNG